MAQRKSERLRRKATSGAQAALPGEKVGAQPFPIASASSSTFTTVFQFRAVPMLLVWSIVVLLVFPFAAKSPWTVLPSVLAVGTMGALATVLQAHLMDVAREAQTLAAASNHSAFNFANALGPWLGGMAITAGYGWTSTGIVGAATAVCGLLIYAWARADLRRSEAVALDEAAQG